MRLALEIAWVNAHLFGGCTPELQVVDDIVFHRPVDIGTRVCVHVYVYAYVYVYACVYA